MTESKLPLYGQCVRPLTVSPGRLVLVSGSSGSREGELQIANGRSEPIRVQVKPAGRLQGGGTIEVPGGGRSRVSLTLPPEDVAAYQGEVEVTSSEGGEMVTVEAAARPAALRIVAPEGAALDLGRVPAGREARGEVIVRNTGGSPSVIQAQVRAPLAVRPSGEAVRLEPGGQAVFAVTMTGDQPGPLDRELVFSGDPAPPAVSVHLEVLPANGVVAPAQPASHETRAHAVNEPGQGTLAEDNPAARTPMQGLLMAYLASSGLPVPKDRINPYLERVTALELLDRTAHSLTIAWKKPAVSPAGWIIEGAVMAQVREGSGSFVKIWTPMKNWKIVDGGEGRVAVLIEPLPSAAQIELRIMGVDRDEKVSEPSPGFIITTADTWRFPWWLGRVLVICALAAAAYALNKLRLGEWQWRVRRDPKPTAG